MKGVYHMKYHIRVFELDQKRGITTGQYISPPIQLRDGEPKAWGAMRDGDELATPITLDQHLDAEAGEGYRLDRMVSLPGNMAHLLRVVTIHND